MNHKPLREEIDKAILENVEWNSFAIDYVWNGSPERLSKKIISLLKSRLLKVIPKEMIITETNRLAFPNTIDTFKRGYDQSIKKVKEQINKVFEESK